MTNIKKKEDMGNILDQLQEHKITPPSIILTDSAKTYMKEMATRVNIASRDLQLQNLRWTT